MTDFSHLGRLEVSRDDLVPFTFDEIDPPPMLLVRCTVGNAGYQAAIRAQRADIQRRARRARERRGKSRRGRGAERDPVFELTREADRAAYPGNVVGDWRDVVDSEGADTPYGDEDCERFLRALPDWLFDRLRLYCLDPENFVAPALDDEAEDELSGN